LLRPDLRRDGGNRLNGRRSGHEAPRCARFAVWGGFPIPAIILKAAVTSESSG
jgi:hypothetical protein